MLSSSPNSLYTNTFTTGSIRERPWTSRRPPQTSPSFKNVHENPKWKRSWGETFAKGQQTLRESTETKRQRSKTKRKMVVLSHDTKRLEVQKKQLYTWWGWFSSERQQQQHEPHKSFPARHRGKPRQKILATSSSRILFSSVFLKNTDGDEANAETKRAEAQGHLVPVGGQIHLHFTFTSPSTPWKNQTGVSADFNSFVINNINTTVISL